MTKNEMMNALTLLHGRNQELRKQLMVEPDNQELAAQYWKHENEIQILGDRLCRSMPDLIRELTPSWELFLLPAHLADGERVGLVALPPQIRLVEAKASKVAWGRVNKVCLELGIDRRDLADGLKDGTITLSVVLAILYPPPDYVTDQTKANLLQQLVRESVPDDRLASKILEQMYSKKPVGKLELSQWLTQHWEKLLAKDECRGVGLRRLSELLKRKWDMTLTPNTLSSWRGYNPPIFPK